MPNTDWKPTGNLVMGRTAEIDGVDREIEIYYHPMNGNWGWSITGGKPGWADFTGVCATLTGAVWAVEHAIDALQVDPDGDPYPAAKAGEISAAGATALQQMAEFLAEVMPRNPGAAISAAMLGASDRVPASNDAFEITRAAMEEDRQSL